jgi:ligand-binding sensor domain-containing protein
LASYDQATSQWTSDKELNPPGLINACFVGPAGNLYVLGDSWLAENSAAGWKTTNIPEATALMAGALDDAGNIWLVSQEGKILEYPSDNVVTLDQINHSDLHEVFVTGDQLWILAQDQLYTMSIAKSEKPVLKLEVAESKLFEGVYQTSDGKIWVIASNAIWVVDSQGNFTKLDAPSGFVGLPLLTNQPTRFALEPMMEYFVHS